MQVVLEHIGKKFNRQWIFRDLNYSFESGSATAITGNNGSGKSTLLQVIFGYQTHSSGKVKYLFNQQELDDETLVGKVSFAAPYLELPEEFTLSEMLKFHTKLMPLRSGYTTEQVIADCGLNGHENKYLRHFSSGMRQRVKLALALFSDTPLLLLDEPCSNLDEHGIAWYRERMLQRQTGRTVIIASNQTFEYDFCDATIAVTKFR